MWADTLGKSSSTVRDHLKITPNTTKLVHVLIDENEEPVSYWTHYLPHVGQKGRVVICPGKDICPACKVGTYRTARRHAINVWDYEANKVVILEQGNQTMQQLKMILDQFGSFDKIDVSIKRIGEKQQTQYILIPIPRTEAFDKSVAVDKCDLVEAKKPHTVQEIASMIGTDATIPPTQTASTAPIGEPTALQFGKYKGKTLYDIATEDLNYIKWCAENITDANIRAEAERIYKLHSSAEVFPQKTDTPPAEEMTPRGNLMIQINNLLNTDTRYKGQFSLVIDKMREASKSGSHPNGKTLLADYTDEELQKLLESLK